METENIPIPKYAKGDRVEQMSDPKLAITVKYSQWVGHTHRYAFEEFYMECFEEYLTPHIPYEPGFRSIRTTKRLHCQCLYEIENKLPRTIFCFMPCPDQMEILAERDKTEKAKRNV